MWELDYKESWALKDAFELWCWRRLLRVPWTARRSNNSILKEVGPEYSLEGLMLKLNLQYFDHLMWRTGSLEKTLMLGKIEGRRKGDDRGWDGWMASLTQWTWVWASSRRWQRTGKPGVLQSIGSQVDRTVWLNKIFISATGPGTNPLCVHRDNCNHIYPSFQHHYFKMMITSSWRTEPVIVANDCYFTQNTLLSSPMRRL